MSADAKAWYDDDGRMWRGLHDGPCMADIPHDQGDSLSVLLVDLERCLKVRLRWEIRQYPDGQSGLVGYEV